jgi:flagellar hook-length control protein FliK
VTALGSGTGPSPTAAATPVAEAGATGAAAAIPVGSQVARHVAVLRGGPDGTQTMTLVLNPENLGPVEVSVTLTQGTVDLTLRGALELGRAALLDGLPDLRRDLEGAGLNCSRLEVDRDTGGSWLARHSAQQQADQQSFGQRGGQDRGQDRSRPWGVPADSPVSGPTPPRNRSTSSGVDLLA